MIAWARDNGAQRLSLAFAAFPEIFNDKNRGKISSLIYTAIHLGDALIALESLYRYLRKFHALGDRRYVMASLTQVLPLLVVLLSLEFMPRRRQPELGRVGVIVIENWFSTRSRNWSAHCWIGLLVGAGLGQAVDVVRPADLVEDADPDRDEDERRR